MATDQALVCVSIPAGEDLSTKQYKTMNLNSSGQVVTVSSAGGRAVGVLQNDPDTAGQAATVAIGGICKVKYGGNITAGNNVQADSDGDVIVAASGDYILGVAMVSGVDGDIGSVLLVHNHILA